MSKPEAREALRIVVLPEADSAEPIIDLVRSLTAQRLIDPRPVFVRGLEDGTLESTVVGPTAEDDDVCALRDRIVRSATKHFVVMNLVTADAIPAENTPVDEAHPAVATACRVDQLVREARAITNQDDGGVEQDLETVNLVIPAAVAASIPSGLCFAGPTSGMQLGWSNLLVSPEIQERSGQAVVALGTDVEYVAHAVGALLTLCASWAGTAEQPSLPKPRPGNWHLLRCRTRSILAPELPDRVVSRVSRSGSQLPHDRAMEFQPAPGPDAVAETAATWFVGEHRLRHVPYEVKGWGNEKIPMTIRQFLSRLWAFITNRMGAIAAEQARGQIAAARESARSIVQRVAGLGGSSIGLTRQTPSEQSGSGDFGNTDRGWQFVRPEPAIWASLRQVSFALIDGGELPDGPLPSLLGTGNLRYVVTDRRFVVPERQPLRWTAGGDLGGLGPRQTGHAVDPEWVDEWRASLGAVGVAAAEDGDEDIAAQARGALATLDAAIDDRKRSFMWRLSDQVLAQRNQVRTNLAHLRAELEKALNPDEDELNRQRKQARKSALIRFTLGMLAVAAVYFIYRNIPQWVDSTRNAVILRWVLIAIGLAIIGFAIWRIVYRWFLAEYQMHWYQLSYPEILREAILAEDFQDRRLTCVLDGIRDWADIISTICHEPFGPPRQTQHPRVRDLDLGLPLSHQAREGVTSPARLDGIVAAVASEFIKPGWLTAAYLTAADYAKAEHELRTGGQDFAPDRDTSGAEGGHRANLVTAVTSGRAREYQHLALMRKAYETILEGDGFGRHAANEVVDRLFTPFDDGLAPAAFLDEVDEGVPSEFNREMVFPPILPVRSGVGTSHDATMPTLPDLSDLVEGASVSFPPLVFTSWAVESKSDALKAGPEHPVGSLRFLTPDPPTPADIRLDEARTRWVRRPAQDGGTITLRDPGERSSWVLDPAEVPTSDHMVSPSSLLQRSLASGSFSFIVELGGEPARPEPRVPIKWALRSDCAAPGAVAITMNCLQRIADASGWSFVFDGTFDGPPTRDNDRIEIGWAFDEEFRAWERANQVDTPNDATTIGWGGPQVEFRNGEPRVVGGVALLNAEMDADPSFGPGPTHGYVLLHELGHALNLGHVEDPREIMCPGEFAVNPLDLGRGDRAGLQTLAG